MRPTTFNESNATLTAPTGMTDAECAALPVWRGDNTIVSCWKMSWRERLSAAVFGRVWLYVMAPKTHPPVACLAQKTVFEVK